MPGAIQLDVALGNFNADLLADEAQAGDVRLTSSGDVAALEAAAARWLSRQAEFTAATAWTAGPESA